jgi:hypothetical protein
MASSYAVSALFRAFTLIALFSFFTVVDALSAQGTILVLARDTTSAYSAFSGLGGYGIPYSVVTVPSTGTTLPALSSDGVGNYGGIVVLSEVSYQYTNDFLSALTTDQWNALYNYQIQFGVRMVRLDVYPSSDFGKYTLICLHMIMQ